MNYLGQILGSMRPEFYLASFHYNLIGFERWNNKNINQILLSIFKDKLSFISLLFLCLCLFLFFILFYSFTENIKWIPVKVNRKILLVNMTRLFRDWLFFFFPPLRRTNIGPQRSGWLCWLETQNEGSDVSDSLLFYTKYFFCFTYGLLHSCSRVTNICNCPQTTLSKRWWIAVDL